MPILISGCDEDQFLHGYSVLGCAILYSPLGLFITKYYIFYWTISSELVCKLDTILTFYNNKKDKSNEVDYFCNSQIFTQFAWNINHLFRWFIVCEFLTFSSARAASSMPSLVHITDSSLCTRLLRSLNYNSQYAASLDIPRD